MVGVECAEREESCGGGRINVAGGSDCEKTAGVDRHMYYYYRHLYILMILLILLVLLLSSYSG